MAENAKKKPVESAKTKAPKEEKAPAEKGRVRVLVDMRVPMGQAMAQSLSMAEGLSTGEFQLDTGYEPVPATLTDTDLAMELETSKEEVVTVRGTIEKDKIKDLKNKENIVDVWLDTEIAPFGNQDVQEQQFFIEPSMALDDCPIPPCDCDQGTAACSKGSVEDVARYLGADQIWETGKRGQDIVIGIVDGGITAKDRPIKSADTNHTGTPNCPPSWPMSLISRVIGGWPTNDWGTTGVAWCWHGNMTATDALGMAPQAKIYDIRISDGNAISNALAGFQWAMNQHRTDGTPHILSNSWGIFQESWDPTYARNPNHPFTRKVVEAINQGILVLFAAGNCGQTCPSGRCGNDVGPSKSIWGANGHPSVITVGAANIQGRLVGYSSQGPAALDSYKPDFCSISHFTGYFGCDTGTSAACPVAAGVVALLKQCKPTLTQDAAKKALKSTASNIGPHGWDQHSGSGIIQAKKAYDQLCAAVPDTCQRYRTIAQRYLSIYQATGNSSYLNRYYHYLLLYFWCRYKAAGSRSDLAQCRMYHALSLGFV